MKKRYFFTAGAVVFCVLLLIARQNPEFSNFYATYIYSPLATVIGGFIGVFPFSLGELLIIVFVLSIPILSGVFAVKLIRKKGQRKKFLLNALSVVLTFSSSVFLVYMLACGVNYGRFPFSYYAGFETGKYSVRELKMLCENIIENANTFYIDEKSTDISREAVAAMKKMGEKYPVLDRFYPLPKPVNILAEPMCYIQIAGIYFPFTIEANYNNNILEISKGFVICHELSHLSGFMREDEANFIAFLACRDSESEALKASAYIEILPYCLNAYYKETDAEQYAEMFSLISEPVKNQLILRSEFWSRYDTPVAEAASAINNTYLKANNQEDGVKSYGRVVDLLLADFINGK